jgi:hypothetical protein
MSILEALATGPRTSKEIQAVTNLSQATVSRLVRNSSEIIRLPGPKPYRYAAVDVAFGSEQKIPIATVDTNGKNVPRGLLCRLQPDGYFFAGLSGASFLFNGCEFDALFDSLPYFMEDARPQGFLGRLIAQRLSSQSDEFPPDPDHWTVDQVGKYLLANGDDLPGDLVFGFSMMNRLRNPPQIVSRENYHEIAEATLEGITGVSSAGGEQQKFTAFISDIESHVIVKFTPSQDDLTSERWRDILVTEYHALSVLSDFGFPAAETTLYDQNGRYFLESKRFDRRGKFGRISMFSLRTVDAEFVGSGGSWTDVYGSMVEADIATMFDHHNVVALELFGKLINNTDRHLGNLSVSIDGETFSLLPVYDMCSMGFAPKGSEVTSLKFEIPEFELTGSTFDSKRAVEAAIEFWKRVPNDPRTSNTLRKFIEETAIVDKINRYLIG